MTDPRSVVPIENEILGALLGRDWTVATAESLTAGAVATRLCTVPGTGGRVGGGVVTYSTAAKRQVLKLTAEDVVTAEAAREMARSVRALFDVDLGVGVTGVAGPESQEGHPVGTVFVGWSTSDGEGSEELACTGAPEQIRREAADQALVVLRRVLRGDPPAAT